MLRGHLLRVKGSLCFVVDQYMLRRYRVSAPGVRLHVVVNATDKGFAIPSGRTHFVLQDFYQWAVSGEENGG
jgi:hypothetical protein